MAKFFNEVRKEGGKEKREKRKERGGGREKREKRWSTRSDLIQLPLEEGYFLTGGEGHVQSGSNGIDEDDAAR